MRTLNGRPNPSFERIVASISPIPDRSRELVYNASWLPSCCVARIAWIRVVQKQNAIIELAVAPSPPMLVRSHVCMNTVFELYLSDEDEQRAIDCCEAVFEELDRVENTFSRFRRASEIARISRLASLEPVVTDPEVFQLLKYALEMSAITSGAFDITVGPLTTLWKQAIKERRLPSEDELLASLPAVGWRNVVLDDEWRTVHFALPGVELDLGGIAKGYAVDRAVEILAANGISAAVDAGNSSIAVSGISGWRVAVSNPLSPSDVISEIALDGRALSTSGSRCQSFEFCGRSYHHLVDPKCATVEGRELQVTVLAPNSTCADALSTAMFILGPERGIGVLASISGCSALWITNSGNQLEFVPYQWPGIELPVSVREREING